MSKIRKSEILFLYESLYNIPNGDPFTGEQRYDEETKKILISDVRIKRFIRTYLEEIKGLPIYVSDKTGAGKTDAKNVIKWIAENRNKDNLTDIAEILKLQIDVRLFGGISTLDEKGTKAIKVNDKPCTNGHVQFTGSVQFGLLNPSLNKVNLRMHQNTTHFTSKESNTQGSIGTTTLVPYAVNQIHGWVNPKVAEHTGMTNEDLKLMYEGLWYGTSGDGSSHSRSKVGQNSLLLLEIVYKENNKKVYGVDKLIKLKLKNGKKDEEIRSMEDFDFDFGKLVEVAESDKIQKIRYFSELDTINNAFKGNEKFEKLSFETTEKSE